MRHTPGPWREGKWGGAVVSDHPVEGGGNPDAETIAAYGRQLICESATTANRQLIMAAPEMFHLLQLIVSEFESDPMSTQCFDLSAIVKPSIELIRKLKQ